MNRIAFIRHPGVDSLLEVLRHEREVLEQLIHLLREANQLVESRRDLDLALALDDVAALETQLGEAEVLRAILVAGIAERWNVAEHQLSLQAIIQRSRPEEAVLLEKELKLLTELTSGIDAVKHSISVQSAERLAATQAIIVRLVEGHAGRPGSPQ